VLAPPPETATPTPAGTAGATACPLCGATGHAVVGSCPTAEVFEALGRTLGAALSPAAVAENTHASAVTLRRCLGCDLEYFVPLRAGTERFYAEIGACPAYYVAGRWEFDFVCAASGPTDSILDVGAGSGHFLERCRAHGRKARGLDPSPVAVGSARARGLDVAAGDVASFAAANPDAFDVVTAFHVVEHIERPVEFVAALARLCRPGGRVIVALPNRLSAHRPRGFIEGPLDCPPHHVSRWTAANLARLGQAAGLGCERVEAEHGPVIAREALKLATRRFLGERLGLGDGTARAVSGLLGRVLVPRALHPVYRATGILERLGGVGLSMAAVYRKPG